MKEKQVFILKTCSLFWIIILYHIIGSKSIFLYTLSLSLYNIFVSCFNHISIKDTLKIINNNNYKLKIFKIFILVIGVISLVFLLLSILISDITSILLKIDNILPIFIMMGLTIIIEPLLKVLIEYLESINNKISYLKIIAIYNILDKILLLLIAIFVFRIFKLNITTSITLLYLSKIMSFGFILLVLYLNKRFVYKNNIDTVKDKINYKKEIKQVFANNSYLSMINIVKYSYYYISIIILYLVLSTRYNYKIDEIEKIIPFIYFYALTIIDYVFYVVKEIIKDSNGLNKLYHGFKVMLTFTIVFGIISPLICKLLFNNPNMAIYLIMTNVLAIFILLFDITYEAIFNKVIIYISLSIGLLFKIILIIPLINSFYRMGYNLLYGDIVSSIIGMFVSVIINYIYLRNKEKKKDNYFEKILDILYENIILTIILVLTEFIVPIDTSSYIKTIGLIIIYLTISIIYINLKNKKRG